MSLPEQLLLSDLLRRRVRCDQGLDHGAGVAAWMHPPVHRLLGWASRPSAFGSRREVWRLNQLRGLSELEALVKGAPAETDLTTLEQLPTLIQATLVGSSGEPLGTLVDAAVELATGTIRHYLVSRSDPRLPGSSRWRLSPDRIDDQRPGEVRARLQGLDDLPLARASVRQEFLRRSRRWRDQVSDLGDRFEQRVEGWLEEPPWPEQEAREPQAWRDDGIDEGPERSARRRSIEPEPWEQEDWPERSRASQRGFSRAPEPDDDPWI